MTLTQTRALAAVLVVAGLSAGSLAQPTPLASRPVPGPGDTGSGTGRLPTVAAPQPVQLAPSSEPVPDELKGIGIEEHLDLKLPLDLKFTDESGQAVELGKYFDGKRPVILTLVYFGCPMLCGLVSNAQMDAMKHIDGMTPGQQYQAVTVSFDPRETHDLAAMKKLNYVKAWGSPEVAKGWHFLTGKQEEINRLTGATGFKYRWDNKTETFIHAPAIMIITPDGRISRYLHGVGYDPRVLRLSLVEASQGKIGTTTDHVLLYCFQYDPHQGAYTLAATNIMTAAAVFTVLIMAAWLVPAWVRGNRRARREATEHERMDV